MIRKFLVIIKQQVFMTSARQEVGEAAGQQQQVFDVVMPIKVFWQIKKQIIHLDYLNSSAATPSEISEVFRTIFKLIAPYAASEKDRDWLYEQCEKT